MNYRNRIHNSTNPFQGKDKKVLSVCSAGLLRSPTIAWVLSQDPWNFNTRACGAVPEFALIPLDPVLIEWADEITVVEKWMQKTIEEMMDEFDLEQKPIHILNIEDKYKYRDPSLVKILKEKFKEMYKGTSEKTRE